MKDARSSGWPGGHLDSLLTLTNVPLSSPKAELCVCACTHSVWGRLGRAAEVIPGLSAALPSMAGCALPCPFHRQSEIKWQLR